MSNVQIKCALEDSTCFRTISSTEFWNRMSLVLVNGNCKQTTRIYCVSWTGSKRSWSLVWKVGKSFRPAGPCYEMKFRKHRRGPLSVHFRLVCLRRALGTNWSRAHCRLSKVQAIKQTVRFHYVPPIPSPPTIPPTLSLQLSIRPVGERE